LEEAKPGDGYRFPANRYEIYLAVSDKQRLEAISVPFLKITTSSHLFFFFCCFEVISPALLTCDGAGKLVLKASIREFENNFVAT
jgi:hypothetical protein